MARAERLESCEADEVTRKAARSILDQYGIVVPAEFAPRDCIRLADEYAQRLREAGPLTP